ncbi:MAG TPA: sigma-54-dependent Fis family transcriptional regulator [Oceanospirillales bacterium]|nr:sigma-54-dependent Fis family transcriptional regulator [Oceanospirillales bacterium]
MTQEHILIVDDEPDIRNLISDILADEGYSVATAANGDEANEQVKQRPPQLILLDIWMPDIDGISLLKSWMENKLVNVPIVMMSGHGTVETAVEATRLGAKDFIEKPLSLAKLLQTVADTLAQFEQEQASDSNNSKQTITEPIGNSAAIKNIKSALQKIYKTKNHVVIEGQSGTGKYTTAMLIHHNRHNASQPCILFDAQTADSSFDKHLTEAQGLFNKAKAGSLIISNIDCLNAEQQNTLFSYLKLKQFTIYGQNSAQAIQFQILALSKKDLVFLVNNGLFSADLYELLAEVKLYLPSLEQRQEDIPELLNYYANTLPDLEQTPYRKMSFAVQNRLRNHTWKNNIQELKNTVRQLLLAGGSGEISLEEVEQLLAKANISEPQNADSSSNSSLYDMPLREAREAFEKDYLLYQLKAVGGRVGELAKIAGMERTHLYRKLRTLNINPKDIEKS